MSILEGEGLFNDVTAIVLYHVAIAAALSGSFSPWRAGLDLVLSAVVAVAVGVALGWGANKLMDLLGDATLQIGMTLLVPYASYVLAEEFHGSGVLAVLTTALFLAEYASDPDDVMTRLAGHTFWDIVDTLVTGVAFGLIGLELHNAIRTASGRLGRDARVGGGDRGGGRARPAAVAVAGDLAHQAPACEAGPRRGHPDEPGGRPSSCGGRGCGEWRPWRWRWRFP